MVDLLQHNQGFTVKDTHGIHARPDNRVISTSDALGWPSIYASLQRGRRDEADFAAVDDHLIILHLDGQVGVRRRRAETATLRKPTAADGAQAALGGIRRDATMIADQRPLGAQNDGRQQK